MNTHFIDPSWCNPWHCSLAPSTPRSIHMLLWGHLVGNLDDLPPRLWSFEPCCYCVVHLFRISFVWKLRWYKQYHVYSRLDAKISRLWTIYLCIGAWHAKNSRICYLHYSKLYMFQPSQYDCKLQGIDACLVGRIYGGYVWRNGRGSRCNLCRRPKHHLHERAGRATFKVNIEQWGIERLRQRLNLWRNHPS